MTSRRIEDVHETLLKKLLSDSGLECVRPIPESVEPSTTSGESEEQGQYEEEQEIVPEIEAEEETVQTMEEIHEELPDIFPTPSLRRVIPERLRMIEEQNRIHVLPQDFKTSIDPAAIPKIAVTAQQKYIDILAEIVGCSRYKSSLAEFWFLDTLANLLRRAQEDGLDRTTQAVLILWFCEWMKEMQQFDAAERQRMLRRFQENMLAASNFVGVQNYLPTPAEAGVYYKPQEDEDDIKGISPPLDSKHTVKFEGASYECSLRDLTTIIHYIFDLFSTDYQYNLVRSVFTFTPDYILIDAPYQIQNPKRQYAPVKMKLIKKEKSPKKEAKSSAKRKKEVDTEEYLALMELKAKEQRELEEKELRDYESWDRKSHILPLRFAADDAFFDKYWPPPPPEPLPEFVPEAKSKAKGKGKK